MDVDLDYFSGEGWDGNKKLFIFNSKLKWTNKYWENSMRIQRNWVQNKNFAEKCFDFTLLNSIGPDLTLVEFER